MRKSCGFLKKFYLFIIFLQKLECQLLHIVNSFILGICCRIHYDELLVILNDNNTKEGLFNCPTEYMMGLEVAFKTPANLIKQ